MWGWIVLGIFALMIIFILSIRVTFTVIFDEIWTTKFKVLFFEKSFDLNRILNGVLFPPAPSEKVENKPKKEPKEKKKKKQTEKKDPLDAIKKIYDKDGVAGIIEFVQMLWETMSDSISVLFKHLVIDILDVKIVVAGDDAALTARKYGKVVGAYYPFIGVIRNGMKVKKYKEDITADFLIAEGYEKLFFKGSICVMYLIGIVLVGAKTFLVNLKNSKK